MTGNMSQAQMREQIKAYLRHKRQQMLEQQKKFDAETEIMFPIIHANYEKSYMKE